MNNFCLVLIRISIFFIFGFGIYKQNLTPRLTMMIITETCVQKSCIFDSKIISYSYFAISYIKKVNSKLKGSPGYDVGWARV